MIRIGLAAMGLGLALATSAHGADACAPRAPAAVVETMRGFFAALAEDDHTRLRDIQAPDFYAFDVGARFDGMALADLVKAEHAKGVVLRWSVTQPDVRMACDTAWITYVNDGAVGDAAGTKLIRWLESAALRYEDSRWRVEFLHSTRMDTEPSPASQAEAR